MKVQAPNRKSLSNLIQTYKKIKSSKINTKVKLSLLESITESLKQFDNHIQKDLCNSQKQLEGEGDTTCKTGQHPSIFSTVEISSLPTISFLRSENENLSAVAQLQSKIIEKQKLKFMLNDEIETNEDDLYHIDKVMRTKQQYNDMLDQKIAQATYEISRESSRKRAVTQPDQRVPFSQRIKLFLF